MVRWEVFDREKRFDRYTAKDGRQGDRINFASTLPSATAAAAAGLIMPAAFLSVKALDAKANPKSKMWDDEAWRRYVLPFRRADLTLVTFVRSADRSMGCTDMLRKYSRPSSWALSALVNLAFSRGSVSFVGVGSKTNLAG